MEDCRRRLRRCPGFGGLGVSAPPRVLTYEVFTVITCLVSLMVWGAREEITHAAACYQVFEFG